MAKVVKHQFGWNPKSVAYFRVMIEGNDNWSKWIPINPEQVPAVTFILKEEKIFFDPNTNSLSTNEDEHYT